MDPFHSAESINAYFIDQVKSYAIIATDTKGMIIAWNKGAERMKGYREEEIVGQFYGILHPYEYQRAGTPQKELETALQQGVFEAEDWRKKKDDSLFWASVILTPIFSDEGEHIGFTKVTGDLTRQKELQDKLVERQQDALELKNKELQMINQDLDNFIYTASHDLRAPIINIEALVAFLKEELFESNCLNEDAQELLHRVISSVNRFKHTLEDLTEITRLSKDPDGSPVDEIINVDEIYGEIRADLSYLAELDACFIQTDFQVYQLKFSRRNFRSILYNLLSNAIKYQSRERPCIVHIHTRLEEPYVLLSVKDNGLGLNARQQEYLFTMFKRFHDHVEGTGIGLYMVKRIVENAGGKIEVESQEGTGTEFKIYFKASM